MNYTHWQLNTTNNQTITTNRIISYDSEFVRERSYYPKLALIQLHQPHWTQAQLHDPLENDLSPIWQSLLNHPAPIVMHAGYQDLELMLAETGRLPQSIRDTQIGFSLFQPQKAIGYAGLIQHYLGIDLDKTETRSDWLARPLTQSQLNYAADDVGLLSRVYPMLVADLARLDRLTWWQEESTTLLTMQTQIHEELHWYKLRTAPQKLRKNHIPIAEALITLREYYAAEKDLPRRKILADEAIVSIALHQPRNYMDLAEYLHEEHIILTDANLVTEAFSKALNNEIPQKPRAPRLDVAQRRQVEKLEKMVYQIAIELNISSDTLATPKQIRDQIAYGESPLIKGWRKNIFEQLL